MLLQKLNVPCNISSMKEKSRVPWTGILEGCKPGKSSLSVKQDRIVVVLTSLGQQPLPRDTSNMSMTTAPAAVVPATMGIIAGAPAWSELFMNAEHIFAEPVVEFGVLTASLFTSTNTPDAFLAKLEALA